MPQIGDHIRILVGGHVSTGTLTHEDPQEKGKFDAHIYYPGTIGVDVHGGSEGLGPFGLKQAEIAPLFYVTGVRHVSDPAPQGQKFVLAGEDESPLTVWNPAPAPPEPSPAPVEGGGN